MSRRTSVIKEVNYFGFDHEVIKKRVEGDLTYLRTFQIDGGTWAVYYNAKPNKAKGHKKYCILSAAGTFSNNPTIYISGRTQKEMNKVKYQHAIKCLRCKTVLYSINVHHFHSCGCPAGVFVDGGRDYFKYGFFDRKDVKPVRVNLLTGKILKSK